MEQSTLNLVMRAKQGDEKAIAALVKLYHPSVKQTIRSYIGNEADYKPVETQAFANAFTHFNTLQNPKDFDSWLDGYVRKESVNHLLNPIANAVKEADNAPSRPSAPESYEMPHFNSEETGVQPSAGDPEFRKEIDASDLYSLFSDAPAPKKPEPASAESSVPPLRNTPVSALKQESEEDEAEEEEDTVPRRRLKKQEEEPKKKHSLKSLFMEEDEDDDEDEEEDEEEEAPRRKPEAVQEARKPRTLKSTYEDDDEEDEDEEDGEETGSIPGGVLIALIVILAVIALGLGTYFIAPGIYDSTFGKLPFLPSAEPAAATAEPTAVPAKTPAPTATPEPSASASASAEPTESAETSSVVGTVTVNVSGLNIRASASTSGEKVGTAESGKSYDVLSTSNDGTYTWYQIGEKQYIADNGSWCTYKAN